MISIISTARGGERSRGINHDFVSRRARLNQVVRLRSRCRMLGGHSGPTRRFREEKSHIDGMTRAFAS